MARSLEADADESNAHGLDGWRGQQRGRGLYDRGFGASRGRTREDDRATGSKKFTTWDSVFVISHSVLQTYDNAGIIPC
jgi:hypothetical protein